MSPRPRFPSRTLPEVSSRPTLVVFTLGPRIEARRRQLLGPTATGLETQLYRQHLKMLLDAGREADLRLVVASNTRPPNSTDLLTVPQPVGSFGNRLVGSLDAACGRMTTPWIVVGVDCPEVDAECLRHVRRRLRESPRRVVLGPARDGGVYLIAANRDLRSVLGKVSWGHRRTAKSLRGLLAAQGFEVVDLALRSDLDQRGDLKRWLDSAAESQGTWSELIAAARRLLAPALLSLMPATVEALRPTVPAFGGRAPPL